MALTFLLIDFENVQPKDVAALRGGDLQLKIFVGSQQTKLSLDLALVLHELGRENAEYIRIAGSGPNALDLHIAYYVGRLSASHPDANFVILSKDRDYDVLVKHLQSKGIQCRRTGSLDDVKANAAAAPRTPAKSAPGFAQKAAAPDPIDRAIAHLRKIKANLPATPKSLASALKAQAAKGISDREVQRYMDELQRRKLIVVEGKRVKYVLD